MPTGNAENSKAGETATNRRSLLPPFPRTRARRGILSSDVRKCPIKLRPERGVRETLTPHMTPDHMFLSLHASTSDRWDCAGTDCAMFTYFLFLPTAGRVTFME
ncbi:hypothetical protein AVEN_265089-1 [Araneus ventricosus]|uniref:Uncharacterized protein n=1 Tax=Araneus ventricosus TaxID=182803 RepID=A0A4Y2U2H1_ARAVE|nr:hypothetical protein AVEN_265089-1 [Araneus ventricosus]